MAPAELVASLPETALGVLGYGISRGQLSEDERTFHGRHQRDCPRAGPARPRGLANEL
jgi:hypothetical protein